MPAAADIPRPRGRDGIMTPAFSIYLDLVRGTAALLVLFYHAATNVELGGAWLRPAFAHTGTPGVIIFFVLSGFVISWATDTKEKTFQVFIINRLARLWSVVIPALVVTFIADQIGFAIYPQVYLAIENWTALLTHPFGHLAMSGVFLNQIWFLNVRPLSNSPFWSLSYEWWYYVAFGCFMLIPGRAGALLGLAALAIMGPKIWLLFPVWLMGVVVYRRLQVRREISIAIAGPMFLAPLGVFAVFWLYSLLHLRERVEALIDPDYLAVSIIFIPAILFGAQVALNLFAFPSLERYLAPGLTRIERPVRWVAGATLSIYLFHYPLLYFFGAVFHVEPASPFWINGAIVICTLAGCFALSAITEDKKRPVRGWIEAAWSFAAQVVRGKAAAPAG